MLSALGTRIFLLHNVHDPGLVVFQTRWTMSYLRGPLSRDQIRLLTAGAVEQGAQGAEAADPSPEPRRPGAASRGTGDSRTPTAASSAGGTRAVLPPGIPQVF